MRKTIVLGLIVLSAVACGPKDSAVVDVNVLGGESKEFIVSKLTINQINVIDTVKTNEQGKANFKVKILDDAPNFYYLSYNRKKLASLILKPGDKVKVSVDTLGRNLSITGSDESVLLEKIEKDLMNSTAKFDSLSLALFNAVEAKNDTMARKLRYDLGKLYVKQKQNAIRGIMTNPYSFTNITLLYQQFTENLPVFADAKDGLFMKRVHDSLYTLYPNSVYVKALKVEIDKIGNAMELSDRLSSADESAFPNISLPDVNSKKIELNSLLGRPFILMFWSANDVKQKIFNQDLAELYKKYNSNGLEIYQVCVDIDKTAWATAVKDQSIPWISVCDGFGTASQAITTYNIASIPSMFIFDRSGNIVAKNVFDKSKLDAQLAKAVK
ncbi:MAG: TlpA disulfide reductase family protein [Bacteroidales bacterium]